MARIQHNPNVMWREEEEALAMERDALDRGEEAGEEGTSVLFSGGSMLSLNVIGTEIWRLCDGRSIEEVVEAMLERFEVDEQTLRGDVSAFLDELAAKGFISYEE